jgi:hypothetical protein
VLFLSVAAAVASSVCVSVADAVVADGGSGTYTSTAGTYAFDLFNDGPAAWQYFILVGTADTRFVGGTTGNESSARCVVGQPDGQPNEIECGPMSVTVIPPNGHIAFVATLSAFPACGASFQLYAGATGTPPFSRVGDAVFTGSCTAPIPQVLTPPVIEGVPAVGRTLTARAPTWSAAPTNVTYQWQLCAARGCVPIRGATRLTVKLTRRMARHTVRIASIGTLDGRTVTSVSKRIAVRA